MLWSEAFSFALGRVVLPVSVAVSEPDSMGSVAVDGFAWLPASGMVVRDDMVRSKLTMGDREGGILNNASVYQWSGEAYKRRRMGNRAR